MSTTYTYKHIWNILCIVNAIPVLCTLIIYLLFLPHRISAKCFTRSLLIVIHIIRFTYTLLLRSMHFFFHTIATHPLLYSAFQHSLTSSFSFATPTNYNMNNTNQVYISVLLTSKCQNDWNWWIKRISGEWISVSLNVHLASFFLLSLSLW